MNNRLEVLEWDTRFFGFRIGRINAACLNLEELNGILQSACEQQFRCLYVTAAPDDYETAESAGNAGFILVDVRVLLENVCDGRGAPAPRYPIGSQVKIHDPCSDDRALLEEISVAIGHSSRFCFDHSFPPDACPRLYRAWIQKLLADPSVKICTAYSAGKPIGLIACRLRGEGIGVIDLTGVCSQMRGHGVGTALVKEALDWFWIQRVMKVEVVTQGRNVSAQRLYQQMGFFTREMTLFYHKWLPQA